ncbi:diguanylate cyclase [Paraburkholderia fungorum]|uniref:bifunctional diguanylate cyclase/phosphodiesterase n=1 Tax=Paraburkholderia fungorum TaxID=134537 RepID=UPI0038BBF907
MVHVAVGQQLENRCEQVNAASPLWVHNLRSLLLALAATTVACLVCWSLKTVGDEITPIWFANSVLLAQMVVARPRQRYWVLAGGALGNLAARLIAGESLAALFSYSSSGILEVVIALRFVPRVFTVAELIRPKPLARFLVGGVLLAPVAPGLLETALLGRQLSELQLLTLVRWYVSHALGLAIFTPVIMAFWMGEVTQVLRAANRMKTGCLLLLACVVTTEVFGQNRFHLLYWALPPIALLAFQAELAAVLLGLLLCLAIAMWFTMHGLGPFWIEPFGSTQARIFGLQLYYMAALVIALPISASQAQRNRLIARLRDGERRYQVLAENATDIVMSMRLEGRLTYVSPRVTAVLGYTPGDLLGMYYPELVLLDDRAALATAIESLTRGGTEASQDSRFRRPDGQVLWMKTSLRLVIDPFSGKPEALMATVRDITESKVVEQRLAVERRELQALVFRDGLTGLFNRRHFDQELERQWRKEARAVSPSHMAVIMIDIDAFKDYNDHYGHQGGDECLRTIAQAIASAARRPTDVVARYGGEEFALILRDADQQGAQRVAERIRATVENLRIPHPACHTGIVTISVGVAAQRPGEGGDVNGLVAAADRALYTAKQQGRNRICPADADVAEQTACDAAPLREAVNRISTTF